MILCATAMLLPSACSSEPSTVAADPAKPERIDVVAAFYPLQFVAEQVGGDAVAVTNLTPAGAEPHELELSARDAGRLQDADLVVYLDGFAPALDDAIRDVDADGVRRDGRGRPRSGDDMRPTTTRVATATRPESIRTSGSTRCGSPRSATRSPPSSARSTLGVRRSSPPTPPCSAPGWSDSTASSARGSAPVHRRIS